MAPKPGKFIKNSANEALNHTWGRVIAAGGLVAVSIWGTTHTIDGTSFAATMDKGTAGAMEDKKFNGEGLFIPPVRNPAIVPFALAEAYNSYGEPMSNPRAHVSVACGAVALNNLDNSAPWDRAVKYYDQAYQTGADQAQADIYTEKAADICDSILRTAAQHGPIRIATAKEN
ncbi:MAG TPA: hypothetical protein VMY99_05415 [Nevskiaceae bacterium]|nr:hypothetical protein [Nevskiaceae bacterium]